MILQEVLSLAISFQKAALAAGSVLVLTLLVALVLFACDRIFKISLLYFREAIGSSFVFGSLAFVVGLMVSGSRVSAVGAVLPGVLTFIGGVAMYLIVKETSRALIAGVAVFSFSMMLIVGSTFGYHQRSKSERQAVENAYNLEILKWQADVEYKINTYRGR